MCPYVRDSPGFGDWRLATLVMCVFLPDSPVVVCGLGWDTRPTLRSTFEQGGF